MSGLATTARHLRCPVCGATGSFVLEAWDRVVCEWRLGENGEDEVETIERDGVPEVEGCCLTWCPCGHQGPLDEFGASANGAAGG